MTFPAGHPVKSRSSTLAKLFGFGFGLFGVLAAAILLSQAWTWWQARTYVPVEAQVVDADLNVSRGRKGGSTFRATGSYVYQYGGREYTGTDTGGGTGSDNIGSYHEDSYAKLRAALESGENVTVWVDPDRPEVAVFNRAMRWEMVSFLFPFASIFMALGIGGLTIRMAALTEPAQGTLFQSEPGVERFLAPYALWWNLLAWPFAAAALLDLADGGPSAALAALLLPAGGVWLAYKAWKLHRKTWQLGSTLLEIVDANPATFKARIHFNPWLGERCASDQVQHAVSVEIKQVERVKYSNKTTVSTAWHKNLGESNLPRGTGSADVSAQLPAWPGSRGNNTPAYWEVTVRAIGTEARFRLAPEM